VGVRIEPIDRLFASVEWNTGTTYETWAFDPGQYINAYGVTLGVGTPFGGLALRIGGLGFTESPIFQVDFGSRF
jgi:hypothetical protein